MYETKGVLPYNGWLRFIRLGLGLGLPGRVISSKSMSTIFLEKAVRYPLHSEALTMFRAHLGEMTICSRSSRSKMSVDGLVLSRQGLVRHNILVLV